MPDSALLFGFGAADRLPYQGRQYGNTEFEKIQGMLERPFGEWNCRHSWHPIILGVSPPNYSEERLAEMRRYSQENITIDGKTKTRYAWSQDMRRVETAIRQQKDTANLARKSGDKALQQRCQGTVLRLNKYYQQLSEASDLKAQFGRTYVPGYNDTKETGRTLSRTFFDDDGVAIFSHDETPEIQRSKDFDTVASYFHYEDEYGHLHPVLDDNMADADLDIVKEIAEGIKWAKDKYGLTTNMPKTVKLGKLDNDDSGVYNLVTREITISRDIPVEKAFLTTVHEMTHYADDIKGCISQKLLKSALKNLHVKAESDAAVALQFGAVKYFDAAIYNNPMEILAYSVEYEFTRSTGKLGKEILKLWWDLWRE